MLSRFCVEIRIWQSCKVYLMRHHNGAQRVRDKSLSYDSGKNEPSSRNSFQVYSYLPGSAIVAGAMRGRTSICVSSKVARNAACSVTSIRRGSACSGAICPSSSSGVSPTNRYNLYVMREGGRTSCWVSKSRVRRWGAARGRGESFRRH